jgi:hypothetical protein
MSGPVFKTLPLTFFFLLHRRRITLCLQPPQPPPFSQSHPKPPHFKMKTMAVVEATRCDYFHPLFQLSTAASFSVRGSFFTDGSKFVKGVGSSKLIFGSPTYESVCLHVSAFSDLVRRK